MVLIARQALAAGMVLRQSGDAEGCFSFDPANQQQARLAIRMAGTRAKRQMSDEQRAAKTAILAAARQSSGQIPVREATLAS